MDGDSRRITVYDLTGLRVHPNGYRVHQTRVNQELGKYPRNIQDSRGWVADDAGGFISVPKYRNEKKAPSSDAEYIGVEQEDRQEDEQEDEADASGKGKRKKKQSNMGPAKKRKFMQDNSYISALSRTNEGSSKGLGMPSQDLLKNIHYLAAKYYDEHGLLVNAAKRYREAKKLRKLHKLGRSSESTLEDTHSSQGADASDTEQVVDNNIDERRKGVNRDMYRVLDGSALVAVGMLTQEIVRKLVGSKSRSKRAKPLPTSDEAGAVEETGDSLIEDEEDEDVGLTQQTHSRTPEEGSDVEGEDYHGIQGADCESEKEDGSDS